MRVLSWCQVKQMNASRIVIRKALPSDCDKLLQMMIKLAEFEGYLKDFSVTRSELEKRLFQKKDFQVLIAQANGSVAGMLVYYWLPFSYDLKPWAYMKELFVEDDYRSMGLGKMLMKNFARECVKNGCSKIRWDVLSANDPAKNFYISLGANLANEWLLFTMNKQNICSLADIE